MKSGSDSSRAGRMYMMLSRRLLLLLTSVLGWLVMGMWVCGTVRVHGSAVTVDTSCNIDHTVLPVIIIIITIGILK